MEKKLKNLAGSKKPVALAELSYDLRKYVDGLMNDRMTYTKDLGSDPTDDDFNYLATLTDLAAQLRTAVVLVERTIYFRTKIS